MTNAFTLDDLNTALEKKYAPFVFSHGKDKFVLKQILRLSKEVRNTVKAQLEILENNKDELDEDEILAILKAVIENVMDDNADKLFDILDNDLVKVTILFEKWIESSQVGEA